MTRVLALSGLLVLGCAGSMALAPSFTPSASSTGHLSLSVCAEFEVSTRWDLSGVRPILVVDAETLKHPGLAFVQVWRREGNTLTLHDFVQWDEVPGSLARVQARFQGQRGALQSTDFVRVVVVPAQEVRP